LKNGNVVSAVYGDTKQGYDQYKNFFIVFGEKPKIEYSKLNLLINTDNDHEDIRKTIDLEKGKFYLVVQKLPKDIKNTNVWSKNYTFN
jgi:hypothetical protein